MNTKKKLAIFPGTFDPITNGHLDIIRRATGLFDQLVVAVGENPEKGSMLEQSVRVQIIRQATDGIANVRVEAYSGLTVDFVRKIDADVIVRGVRDSSDLGFERQVALTNRAVASVETVFMLASPEFAFTSSSLIRQIASMNGDISRMVPQAVLEHLGEMKR